MWFDSHRIVNHPGRQTSHSFTFSQCIYYLLSFKGGGGYSASIISPTVVQTWKTLQKHAACLVYFLFILNPCDRIRFGVWFQKANLSNSQTLYNTVQHVFLASKHEAFILWCNEIHLIKESTTQLLIPFSGVCSMQVPATEGYAHPSSYYFQMLVLLFCFIWAEIVLCVSGISSQAGTKFFRGYLSFVYLLFYVGVRWSKAYNLVAGMPIHHQSEKR